MVLWALGCAAIAVSASNAVADSATGAPSQEDIAHQLKTRGLPTLGTVPAPQPSTNPAFVPANVPSVPPVAEPREYKHRTAIARPSPGAAPRPSVALNTITFEFGSARLKPDSIDTLHNLGNALNQQLKDEKVFLIEGHTDRQGTRAYNDELSKRRADAVKDYLVNEIGVSPERLQTLGKGFTEPANPKNPYAAENRRVVIVNTGAS
jgi:outer membrane protein OmpA-like peptidoglycan-associated protein